MTTSNGDVRAESGLFGKIASYSASIYGVTMAASAVSFLVTMVVAKRIPREALGAYGFYVTIYALIGMLFASGLNQAVVKFLGDGRRASEGRSDESAASARAEIVRVVLGATGALAIVFVPAGIAAGITGLGLGWTFGLCAIPLSVLILLANSVFRAEFRKRSEITNRLAVSLLNSTLTVTLAFSLAQPDVAPIWGDFLSMALPAAVIAVLFLREAGGVRAVASAWRAPRTRALLRFSVPLSIAGVAFVVYGNAAQVLLRTLTGLAALGEYYFALQLMNVLEKPMTILANVVLAGFSTDPDLPEEEHRRLVGFNLLLFPLLAASVAWGAPVAMRVADSLLGGVKGEALSVKYAAAPIFVALFALAVPLRCVEFLLSALAIARGRPDVNRNTHVATTLVCLPVLALLVWRFGPWGAAAMPLAWQVVFQTLLAVQLVRVIPSFVRHTLRAAGMSTVLLAIVLFAGRLPGAPWDFPIAALAYAAIGHLIGAWDLTTLVPRRRARARTDEAARPSPAPPPAPVR